MIQGIKKCVGLIGAVAITAAGLAGAFSVLAAAPQQVTYYGTPVKTAVPGKPFTINFKVTNTGTSTYSNVRVAFHIPEGMSHVKVSPANAVIEDDVVYWNNVPLEADQSLYPSFTLMLDQGTPLNTKKSIWVEITGDSMETTSTNFSITAALATTAASTTSSSTQLAVSTVDYLFTLVYGRLPTASESTYWQSRRTDKPSRLSLLGAMQWHKVVGIGH